MSDEIKKLAPKIQPIAMLTLAGAITYLGYSISSTPAKLEPTIA